MSQPSDELMVLLDMLHERGEVLPLVLESLARRGSACWVLFSNKTPIKVCGTRERADAALAEMVASAKKHGLGFQQAKDGLSVSIETLSPYGGAAPEQLYVIQEVAL